MSRGNGGSEMVEPPRACPNHDIGSVHPSTPERHAVGVDLVLLPWRAGRWMIARERLGPAGHVRGVRFPGVEMDQEGRFQLLYEQHQPDVLAYFLRRLDREDAVEASADVFLTAWRRIDDVPPEGTRLWLFGVAHNVLANRNRSARRWRRLVARLGRIGTTDPPLLPEMVVVRQAEDDAVLTALAQLPSGDARSAQVASLGGRRVRGDRCGGGLFAPRRRATLCEGASPIPQRVERSRTCIDERDTTIPPWTGADP